MKSFATLPLDADKPADSAPVSGPRLVTPSGASANVEGDRIEVRDVGGKLLFEYDAATGRGSLTMPTGDLALHAPQGNIDIVAGGTVRCRGEKVSFASKVMAFSSERADVLFAEANVRGVRLSATVDQVRMVADRMEQVAVNVLQRAKRVIRHVEGLEQVTAGRSRTIVEGAYSVKAARASVDAEDDVKIDGKRIHLG